MTAARLGRSPSPSTVDFGGLRIGYDERVLTPRPWTLRQSRWAADLLADAPPGPVLELCTGAGHIGLAAVAASTRRLVCVDLDPVAVRWCRANAAANGLAERVEVRLGRLQDAVHDHERFAVVVADPPWVPTAQTGRFPEDPLLAINGGSDGLDLALACLEVVEEHLVPAGSALLQLGDHAQADRIVSRASDRGLVSFGGLREEPGRGVIVRLDSTSASRSGASG